MKLRKLLIGVAAGLPFLIHGAQPAEAVSFGDGGAALQGVLDGITVTPPSSIDVTTDAVADGHDSFWTVSGNGASIGTLIVELAGLASSTVFGVYDLADPMNQVTIFDGAASAGAQGTLSIMDDGSVFVNAADTGVDFADSVFGFFLDSTPSREDNTGVWFSDTSLNPDGFDHMAAYQGTGDLVDLPGAIPGLWTSNKYLLAWEDLNASINDGDFEDFVVMVETVQPVPIPGAVWLFGSGVLAIVGMARRRRQAA